MQGFVQKFKRQTNPEQREEAIQKTKKKPAKTEEIRHTHNTYKETNTTKTSSFFTPLFSVDSFLWVCFVDEFVFDYVCVVYFHDFAKINFICSSWSLENRISTIM